MPLIWTYFSCPISTILKPCPLHFKMLTPFFIISPYVVFLTYNALPTPIFQTQYHVPVSSWISDCSSLPWLFSALISCGTWNHRILLYNVIQPLLPHCITTQGGSNHFRIVPQCFLWSQDLLAVVGAYDLPLKLDRISLTLLPHEDSSSTISRPKPLIHSITSHTAKLPYPSSSSCLSSAPQWSPYLYEYSINLHYHLWWPLFYCWAILNLQITKIPDN